MSFAQELLDLTSNWKPGPQIPQTEDELLSAVWNACKAQARTGRRRLDYIWALPCTSKEDWDRTSTVRDSVIRRLQAEGVKVEGLPQNFTDAKVWNEWTLECDPPEVRHRIIVEW